MDSPIDMDEARRFSAQRKWWHKRVTAAVVGLLILLYVFGVYDMPWYGALMLWGLGYGAASLAVNMIAMRGLLVRNADGMRRFAEQRQRQRFERP